jgi:two-component SAPR family response regulator
MKSDEQDFKNAVTESLEKGSYNAYMKVCEIYQGAFLATMNSPWILKYRLEYEKQYYQVLEKLTEYLLADKQFEAALPYSELLVEHEPMFPKYVNYYINGLIGMGDDFKAKQALDEFRSKWTKELKRDLPEELLEVAQWVGMR